MADSRGRADRAGALLRTAIALTTCAVTLTAGAMDAAASDGPHRRPGHHGRHHAHHGRPVTHRHPAAHHGHHSAPVHAGAHGHRGCPAVQQPRRTTEADWTTVSEILGRKGAVRDHVTFGFLLPRDDLRVTTHGVTVVPPLALAGSAAFVRYCDGTMLMGDLVLTADEVDPTIDALRAAGIEQTALHKHLSEETPPLWWVHFHAMGEPESLAHRLKRVLEVGGSPARHRPENQDTTHEPARSPELDTLAIDRELGRKGNREGKVYLVFVSRRKPVTVHGHVLPGSIGCNTAIMFQALGRGKVAANGDLILTANEVQPAMRALREHGIRLVELHNHMLDEQPRVFFLHFWAVGDAAEVARGLRAGLDTADMAPPRKEPTGNQRPGGEEHGKEQHGKEQHSGEQHGTGEHGGREPARDDHARDDRGDRGDRDDRDDHGEDHARDVHARPDTDRYDADDEAPDCGSSRCDDQDFRVRR
ncbi:DUF1259 domain-containing protein [Streptantibioticus cattleyicolor]|uniref:Lipoprotein n=1 Tax=Streptantibioticus cattleyicolor (strain ATCC 35852 / DSM 46488 / JCM 4925 / NBRC 14057 / NRRL 8057) TaxID=1003195 RepID=F8JMC7_STREN|nr:DUF1259 domain-containing protein [Streptantibioticus cattleyicolor]AEW99181.1 lipoprotein [Streptantibioticus cattleyicolor NRRL 8057 = DSM 46488]CCB71776.1 conserved exported protein of unknown function [Streptantibioticus cattleyicolor NRRL 8057 = DSM 46488]